MPDHFVLVSDGEVQGRVTENNGELEYGLAMLLLGDGALEALLQPQLVAIGAVVHGAQSTDGFVRGKASVSLGSGRYLYGWLTIRFPRGRFGFFVVPQIHGKLSPPAVPEAHFDSVYARGF